MKKMLLIICLLLLPFFSGCDSSNNSNATTQEPAQTTCKIIFNKTYGATGGTDSVTVIKGNDMPDIIIPRKSGYIFNGYYDSLDGDPGTQYYTSKGKSAHVWDKYSTTYHLFAHWLSSDNEESTNGSSENNSTGNLGTTYFGSAIRNICSLNFQVTQFGAGSGYFVAILSLNDGYKCTTSISCTITVTITIYYSVMSSSGGYWSNYSDIKTTSMRMSIPSGGTYGTGSCSVTWLTEVRKTNGNSSCTYRATSQNYSKSVGSWSGTAKSN